MATKSIGLTGRDFSTLAAWTSYVNALTLAAPEIAEVYNDGGPVADNAALVIGGWTGGSATNTVTLRAAAGQGFKDHATASTNPLRFDASKGAALQNSVPYASADGAYKVLGAYVTFDGLQINASGSGSRAVRSVGSNYTLKNCVVQTLSTGAVVSSAGSSGQISNSALIAKGASHGLTVESFATPVTGCTVIKIGAASGVGVFSLASASILLKNTVIVGFTSDTGVYSGGTFSASSANNATSKAAFDIANAGGGTPQVNVAAGTDLVNLTNGSEDLRIKAGSTKLIDTGVTAGLTTDIFGTARPQGANYDIGAHEYAAPASGITGNVTLDNAVAAGTLTSIASSITGNVTLDDAVAAGTLGVAPGVLTTPAMKNNTGTLLSNVAGIVVNVYNATTGSLVVRLTGLTSSGAGVVILSDATLVPNTTYAYEIDITASSLGRILPVGTAA